MLQSEELPREGPPVRVGYVLKMYPRFSETFIVSEILAREALGHDIRVFSLRPPADGRFHAMLADVRAPVTYLPHARIKAAELWDLVGEAVGRLARLPSVLPELAASEVDDAYQALHLALQLEEHGITHLHAHFASVATTVARLASLLTGVPYTFTAHAKDIFHESVQAADLEAKLRDAAAAVTVSDYNATYLRTRFPASTHRLVTVRNGLRMDDFFYRPPLHREPVVAAVGRLVEKKGFVVLLRALALLHGAGRPVRAVLAGAGPLEDVLREQAAALGVAHLVEMPGPLPQHDVRALLTRSAVLAAPCVTGTDGNVDGLPTVLLEAMALGTPVVSTPVTGIPEIVRDGQTGLLVPEGDPVELAGALSRLLDDNELAVRLARQARVVVEDGYDSRRQAEALGDLHRRSIRRTRAVA
jgi:colanic acid/amylovoran biosynthesis glycosyltransferase